MNLPRDSYSIYRFVVSPIHFPDPRSAAYLQDAHALGLSHIRSIECHSLYFIEGHLSPAEQVLLGEQLLSAVGVEGSIEELVFAKGMGLGNGLPSTQRY